MRRIARLAAILLVTAGLVGTGVAAHATPKPTDGDIVAKLKAIPGMKVQEKKSSMSGYRWFWLTYRQPIDHRHPWKGTFEQRIMLEHTSVDRPMILYTSGYNTPEVMFRSEPMALTGGNQISVEYRFFTPSRPKHADWSKDTIWQAAADEHRLIKALKTIYHGKWISTGASKGGMTAIYHKRFFPNDVDGTVAYVAPNDVYNRADGAYKRFLRTVGDDPRCRKDLKALQRELLKRRPEILERMRADAEKNGYTFHILRSVDRAFENSVMDFYWAFWQYHLQSECADVPSTSASTDEIYAYFDKISGAMTYTDQSLRNYIPYYYQAGTQLGWPSPSFRYLRPLLRYEDSYRPRTYVPRDISMRFQWWAMWDIDRWVRRHADHVMFLYGENDPWGAEPFRLGPGSRDSYWYMAPGMDHRADLISKLPSKERTKATATVLRWAGLPQDQAKTMLAREPHVSDPILSQHPPL